MFLCIFFFFIKQTKVLTKNVLNISMLLPMKKKIQNIEHMLSQLEPDIK